MMDNEQILYMIIGQKEKDLVLARMLIRQQGEEIKTLQAAVSEMQKTAKAGPPHPGS